MYENSNIDLFDRIVKNIWIYEKVFWKNLLENLLYNKHYENCKRWLTHIYWYRDIDIMTDKMVNNTEFKAISKILFKFTENKNDNSK